MKISEVSDAVIMAHCGISDEDEGGLLDIYKRAAIAEICNYTALPEEKLDDYPDITYAFLTLVCEMYDSREMTVEITSLNPTAEQILDSHRRNLL